MTTATSNWTFKAENDTTREVAKLSVETVSDTQGPIGLAFRAWRLVEGIDRRFSDVYFNAIRGKAHLNVDQAMCDQVYGHKGISRGALSECSCELLHRVNHPQTRLNYENQAIQSILKIIGKEQPFRVNIAFFRPGELLEVEVLLFRLLNELIRQNAKGKIALYLIDHQYDLPVLQANHTTNFPSAVAGAGYIRQFLTEMCGCLPPSIVLEGIFFKESNEYTALAERDPTFKHHLLISADVQGANLATKEIGKKAGLGVAQPIILSKTKVPDATSLPSDGQPEFTYKIDGEKPAKRSLHLHRSLMFGFVAVAVMWSMIRFARR